MLIYNEHFHVTKTIRAKNVQIVCNQGSFFYLRRNEHLLKAYYVAGVMATL